MSAKSWELTNFCFECRKEQQNGDLKRCSACASALYCDAVCQKKHWPEHKRLCRPVEGNWSDKYRGCQDGSTHQGKLELITWTSEPDSDGERTGFGAVYLNEAEDVKTMFKKKFKGDEEKFFKWRPAAFRWTCCGLDGDQNFGCDHHDVRYPKPCMCDFCAMGKPLPDSIYYGAEASRMGLKLSRGPDPRSFNPAKAALCVLGRTITGLEM
ncbi:hypothetical protein EXIGLDRAFT_664113 [Exidia glandulosa HHB12029]|uniref:MYND-type domain-containing protein n=1 Tax=Exidia glandulosa HHB12029 TaxID=1314781 RepID=A0A165QEZ8_EXIGL|nr:hypothetical protein EXIGLDRAFT_664113 [Exidia glandulosa HHB12029]